MNSTKSHSQAPVPTGFCRCALTAITLLALAISIHSLRYFLYPQSAPLLQGRTGLSRLFLLLHAGFSIPALAIGPFQFINKFRSRKPELHRFIGKIYIIAVLAGALFGFVSALNSWAGLQTQTGFGLVSILWFASALTAWKSARARQFEDHRRWMIRNYAMTFAAVTLRLWLPFFIACGFSMKDSYQTVAWLAWVPNLVVAELWILRNLSPSAH